MRGRIAIAALVALGCAAGIVALVNGGSANGDGAKTSASKRWQPLASSPLQRTEIGSARVGDSIYAVGGYIADPSPTGKTTNRVLRYEIGTNRWTELGPMPLGVNHPAVASFGGSVYVHGGYADDGAATDRLFRFSPESGAWTELRPSGEARAAHSLVPIRGRLYAAGGARAGNALNLLQVYDPAGDSWRTGPSMPTPREHIGAAAVDDKLYVIAGRAGAGNLDVVERFDPKRNRWSKSVPVETARSGFQATTVDGRIVIAGGEGDATIAPVELLDPKRKPLRWRGLPGMRTPRHGLGVVSDGNRVYTVEGGPQPGLFFSDTLEFLDVPKPRRPRE